MNPADPHWPLISGSYVTCFGTMASPCGRDATSIILWRYHPDIPWQVLFRCDTHTALMAIEAIKRNAPSTALFWCPIMIDPDAVTGPAADGIERTWTDERGGHDTEQVSMLWRATGTMTEQLCMMLATWAHNEPPAQWPASGSQYAEITGDDWTYEIDLSWTINHKETTTDDNAR